MFLHTCSSPSCVRVAEGASSGAHFTQQNFSLSEVPFVSVTRTSPYMIECASRQSARASTPPEPTFFRCVSGGERGGGGRAPADRRVAGRGHFVLLAVRGWDALIQGKLLRSVFHPQCTHIPGIVLGAFIQPFCREPQLQHRAFPLFPAVYLYVFLNIVEYKTKNLSNTFLRLISPLQYLLRRK